MIDGSTADSALSVLKEQDNGLTAGDQIIENMIIQLNPGNINIKKEDNGCIRKNFKRRICSSLQ